ncbi:hypothetical protein CASFOL_001335 [Castilleja foliolosa]|uniref:Uncharacterized protein n=1 Tax=Castilleja foliolosa TaxID=1961234 RepID=A0ABD3ER61_9LAMI
MEISSNLLADQTLLKLMLICKILILIDATVEVEKKVSKTSVPVSEIVYEMNTCGRGVGFENMTCVVVLQPILRGAAYCYTSVCRRGYDDEHNVVEQHEDVDEQDCG